MWTAILVILGISLLLIVFVDILTTVNIIALSKVDELTQIEDEQIKESYLYEWAAEQNFTYLGTYFLEVNNVKSFIAAWQHHYEPTFFVAYICQAASSQESAIDFVTYFEKEHSLTTASTPSANLFPLKQGIYRQTFTCNGLDEQYQKHNEAVTYLVNMGGARPGMLSKSVEDYMVEAIHSQMNYVKSLFLWPLRGAFWYFIRKQQWHNRSIERQHQTGKIKMPNDIIHFEP